MGMTKETLTGVNQRRKRAVLLRMVSSVCDSLSKRCQTASNCAPSDLPGSVVSIGSIECHTLILNTDNQYYFNPSPDPFPHREGEFSFRGHPPQPPYRK